MARKFGPGVFKILDVDCEAGDCARRERDIDHAQHPPFASNDGRLHPGTDPLVLLRLASCSYGALLTACVNQLKAMATALGAAAAVGAGVFLWSRRNQISDQLSNLSEQITDWAENMRPGNDAALPFDESDTGTDSLVSAKGGRSSRGKTQQEFAEEALSLKETGSSGSASGRGRSRQQPTG